MDTVAMFRRFTWWTAEHRDIALDVLRMYLGIGLFVRGVLLIATPGLFGAQLAQIHWFLPALAAHYVATAHLIGGILLAMGLMTRLAAFVQVPALLGAVFLIHLREGLLTSGQSLELSALVLVALLVFSVFGAGRLSIDHWLFHDSAVDVPLHARRGVRLRA